jgi:hypothetical protein
MKSFFRHGFEFLLIGFVLIFGIVLLNFVKDYSLRLALIAALALFYVGAGIWHHWEERNLHIKQVLEHLAIGLLIFSVLAAIFR